MDQQTKLDKCYYEFHWQTAGIPVDNQNENETKAFPNTELAEWRETWDLEDLIPVLSDFQGDKKSRCVLNGLPKG